MQWRKSAFKAKNIKNRAMKPKMGFHPKTFARKKESGKKTEGAKGFLILDEEWSMHTTSLMRIYRPD
jgi:hypothetical protein